MSGFKFRPATREETPLLIGLVGPSGSGKTKSALRLADGIVSVRGGQIVGIDTEARRMLHYAAEHKFQYLEFKPPHSSLRYMEALVAAAEEAKGGCVVIDSMSHEHEGEGGYLEYAESEVHRLNCKSEKDMRKWIRPASDRRKLINKLLQLNCAFIFCFRAKEKIKPLPGKEPVQLGWQPIAGEEFSFEMTARCLLLPNSTGIPDWSKSAFEHGAAKIPEPFKNILTPGRQLDEKCGHEMAEWAKGDSSSHQKEDDKKENQQTINDDYLLDMKTEISKCWTFPELQRVFSEHYKICLSANDQFALQQITEAKDKQKESIQKAGQVA